MFFNGNLTQVIQGYYSELDYDLNNNYPSVIIQKENQIDIEGKLVTTNNGITYIIDREDESSEEWQVYAMPEESISQIIYLHSN